MADPLQLLAGELRHQVQIQQGSGSDAGGQPDTWDTVRTAWTKISTASSKETYLTDQFTSEVTHIVSMRWSPTPLSAGMQVVLGSRIFNVQAVENVQERNIRINLMCDEIDGTINAGTDGVSS